MKKAIGVVSTSYHLFVLMFVKEYLVKEYDCVDLVVTDKTLYMEQLCKKGAFNECFHNVFFADAKKIKNPYKNGFVTLYESFIYNRTTKDMMELVTRSEKGEIFLKSLSDKELSVLNYDDLLFASPGMPDEIVKELGKTLIKKNKKLKVHRFEDGFASYTKKPEYLVSSRLGQFLYNLFWKFDITKQESELLMFEPDMAEKQVSFPKKKIPNSKEQVERVVSEMKKMLPFENQKVAERFVFLGQGTVNGMGNPITYQALILEIMKAVSYENIVIKPHPRGEHDEFHGQIKVYQDNCPFEIAVASGEMENKVLISYYSTACVSAKLLFQSNCKIIFLYKLAGDAFNEKCAYTDYFAKLMECYEDVYAPSTKEELFLLLQKFGK